MFIHKRFNGEIQISDYRLSFVNFFVIIPIGSGQRIIMIYFNQFSHNIGNIAK